MADYALVEALMRHPRISGAREARLYQWAVKWLMRFPFLTIVAFTLVPVLPLYVARVLAPASGYPAWRYTLANMVGRLPRFLALAYVGHAIQFPTWVLVGMFVLLIAFLYGASRNTAGAGLDEEEEEGEEILVPDLTDPEHPKPGVSATQIPKMS
jgi:membrane protein DedA with SNARE-associated domain